LMPNREGSFSITVISPRAILRPLTTRSTGSPILRSSATVEPFCSAIRSDTAISELPSTICTSTGMSRMALLPPIPARPGASAASSLRTSRSSSIALLSSSSSTSGVAASALLISILLGPPSGGQQFLDQLALGVVWLDDAHGVVLPEPAELAGEKCAPARGQLGLSRRCLRDFEQLPGLQPR